MCNTRSKEMSFGEAIAALKNGECVRRKSFDEGVIITKQVPSVIPEEIIPRMTSLNEHTKHIILNTCKHIKYNNQLLAIHLLTGDAEQYAPSISDINAKDWEIFDIPVRG